MTAASVLVPVRSPARAIADVAARMRRAEAIIDELTVTLDHDRGGIVASRLHGIYAFSRRQLLDAWREGDADKIDEVSTC
jgi:flagellar protein FliS